MRKNVLFILSLLLSVQSILAWNGDGTANRPYQISSTADWKQLASNVSGGNSYSGKYFVMTTNIDADGVSVGSDSKPFSGTFYGGMYTLTYNRGTFVPQVGPSYVDDYCAPFVRLDGATIRDLKVDGSVYSDHMHAAGIASMIDGNATTFIINCYVSSLLQAGPSISSDASFGGFVGIVNPTCTASPTLNNCTFTGIITGSAKRSSGLVGYTNLPINFKSCIFDPVATPLSNELATLVRMKDGVDCTFDECYYTQRMGTDQGKCIFSEVQMPEGCTAQIVSEPFITLNGKNYYTSGAKVRLTVPEGTQFDHWNDLNGCFINDPWTANGIHTFTDVRSKPSLSIATSMPDPVQDNRERDGVYYRYISNRDYLLFMSDSLRQARGYQFDSDGECYVMSGNTKTYITVVWNCDANREKFQQELTNGWVWDDGVYNGTVIYNDLVASLWDHTHLFAIAPRAFQGVSQLKRIVFRSDIDQNLTSNASMPVDVQIQEQAFKDSGIEQLVMMYLDEGADKWDAFGPTSGLTIAANAFEGTNGSICVEPSIYQSYLNDNSWSPLHNRIAIYAAKVENITQDGVIYSYWRNSQQEAVKNNAAGHESLMQTLKTWNANYANFNAADLLAEQDKENVWYTQIVGIDDTGIDNGKMIIRNDPGTYYNYKTLNIAANAFAGNENLKYIEFEQVVGNRNSYSDLKMVIQNGAFKGCTNLKELRMFYHVNTNSDGSSANPHWMALGPEDVVPGNNIFGLDYPTNEQLDILARGDSIEDLNYGSIPKDFRILVAPERIAEFLQDPNWAPYTQYLQAADLTPTTEDDEFTISGSNGLTYGYITNLGGIRETSQTVSQDVSWWTLPRIAVEVALYAVTMGAWIANNALPGSLGTTSEVLQKTITEQIAIKNAQDAITVALDEVVLSKTTNKLIFDAMLGPASNFFDTMLAGRYVNAIDGISSALSDQAIAQLTKLGWISGDKFVNLSTFASSAVSSQNVYAGLNLLKTYLSAAAPVAATKVTHFTSYITRMIAARALTAATAASTSAAIVSQGVWDGSSQGEALKKGMRDNILSNIHQIGVHGGGYVFTTPTKNLVYHAFLKRVDNETQDAVIYAGTDKGQGKNASSVTMTFARDAFQNHKNLKTVSFHENNISTNEGMPMLLTIPDSAFYGCDNLVEFSTILKSDNGSQVLGPESFILAGDNVFVGLDSLKFHILIDESRKDDYLASESWGPLKRYFQYTNVKPDSIHDEYGGWYGYAYENGSLQKVHKVMGHKIEHMVVFDADNSFLTEHQGALKLCNDIGSYNNYQLDAVRYKAFYGNQNLRVVNFTDLKGTTGFGDTYTGLDVTLEDSCFANCPNLANIDMLYLVTDGTNHIDPITPQQVKIGRGVLDGTTAKIKMMPKQVEWFQKDTTWAKYSDRFLPCIIKVADDEVHDILKDMAYYDMAHTGYDDVLWTDYVDLLRIGGVGFSWLDGKFSGNADIRSFNEFRHFACVGLNYVGREWFSSCSNLSSISLPSTITQIKECAFTGCASLTMIEIPELVSSIEDGAFTNCSSLTSVRVLGRTPATLASDNIFAKSEGLKIYVPDGTVAAYKTAWAEYKDYIVSDKTLENRKVVTVTEPGQLAQKLGLTVEKQNKKVRNLRGDYASIDSLTVTGPLNGEDLAVIRHLSGADAYDSNPTDGCLVYLNLWNADLKKDEDNSYNGNGIDEYIDADNKVPDYLFENCTSIQTVIFPKTVTYIGENIFEDATGMRKLCVGKATTGYECDILQSLQGIDELVLLTDGHATSDYSDPWEAPIGTAYTTNAQVGNYLGDINLTRRADYVVAPFNDDAVMETLADHGHFFPSDYTELDKVEGIFNDNSTITDFSDFFKFSKVTTLDKTFKNATALRTISLPDSIKSIGVDAFAGCTSLDTIYISRDSVPEMAAGALRDLPKDFHIFVPKRLCKLYRTKWAEYADHINVDESLYEKSDIITVELDAPNTLAEKLGLTTTMGGSVMNNCIRDVRGDYSQVYKLKVVGPISGADFDVIRHLAGWCPCIRQRNMAGHLEYLDLYDADIRASNIGINGENSGMSGSTSHVYSVSKDDVMPYHALLKAYNLKTLILPKSCKEVEARAMQECEGLEVIVVGDNMEEFNWNALDDDASLTRMYFLSNQKVELTSQNAIWRALCNNYNPTFDAFYVRPSQLDDYRNDKNYTGSSWQRTNNIQCGIFTDDDEFLPFASHAAVTYDDLATVTDVNGWFSTHKDIKNLSALAYTSIPSLRIGDLHELTQLEKIELPISFEAFVDNTIQRDSLGEVIADSIDHRPFAYANNLRYLSMMACDSTMVIDELRGNIKQKLGIGANALVYVPSSYGQTDEHNIVWGDFTDLQNNYYDLSDTLDYYVPYAFKSRHISNPRVLMPKKAANGTTVMDESKFTVSLPYSMNIPAGAKAYKLENRQGSTLVFREEQNRMTANTPYLLVMTNQEVSLNSDIEQTIPSTSDAEADLFSHQLDVIGYSMRGTLHAIDNKTANEQGAYILQSDNKWHPVPANVEEANIPAFRAYLLQNGGAGVKAFDMELVGDDVVGVDTILTIDRDGNEIFYDLNGRKLNGRPQRGVYIYQGKKYVNK